MTIRAKLLGTFLLIAICFAAIGYYGFTQTARVADSFQALESRRLPALAALLELTASARRASIKAMEYAMRGRAKDQAKADEALDDVARHVASYRGLSIQGQAGALDDLDRKVGDFSAIIQSYLKTSEGAPLEDILSDERQLHQSRRALVRAVDQVAENAAAALHYDLLLIKSEARRVGLKAIEFALRGVAADRLKAEKAMAELRAATRRYMVDSERVAQPGHSIDKLSNQYIATTERYLLRLASRSVSVQEVYELEARAHAARRELIHTLYPLIDAQYQSLDKATARMSGAINATGLTLILSILTLIGIAVAAGWFLARSIVNPIAALGHAAREIGAGRFDAGLRVEDRHDELGDLAQVFRQMSQELAEHREHLEDLVAQRTRALEASNRELEAFSYSIAHDLRTPLRAIAGFSQLVLMEAGDKLAASESDALQRVVAAAKHMAELIDDILLLGKVTRSQLRMAEVDLSALVRDHCEHLGSAHPERAVEWRIEDGVVASGDRSLLTTVLANLLDNAWKYSRHQPCPRIEFGTKQVDGQQVMFVRDNGVGFDMQYAQKIFVPFQRLHTPEQYDGTGVGLATVQRIIARHHGRIWAESEPNAGACFYFTLP